MAILSEAEDPPPVVLVVEAETPPHSSAGDALREIGLEVVEAANTDDAVRYLRALKVDAVLTDVRTPGSMDGLEFAYLVRGQYPDTAVLIVCMDDEAEAAPPGAATVGKPYDAAAIAGLIRRIVRR